MNPIQALHNQGQSLWLDYIRRDLLESGDLANLIKRDEIRGVTSNPTIFEQAIAGSDLYTERIQELVSEGSSPDEILDDIILHDIRLACDLFARLYRDSDGKDGFVSVEVNPKLANNSEATIKIPATLEGLPAIKEAIARGINVNVTLIFSLARYAQVMEAYQSGLEKRLETGEHLNDIASVASFFVSRVDSNVDQALATVISENLLDTEKASGLLGKAAIANAKLAYENFRAFVETDRYRRLVNNGAKPQRPLWASTSTKNPDYEDTYYVTNLIGRDTVNTLPPKTLDAFRDHGVAKSTLTEGLDDSRRALAGIDDLGISMDDVTTHLEIEGVRKFAESYQNLVDTVSVMVDSIREEV
jgi:transaldolase